MQQNTAVQSLVKLVSAISAMILILPACASRQLSTDQIISELNYRALLLIQSETATRNLSNSSFNVHQVDLKTDGKDSAKLFQSLPKEFRDKYVYGLTTQADSADYPKRLTEVSPASYKTTPLAHTVVMLLHRRHLSQIGEDGDFVLESAVKLKQKLVLCDRAPHADEWALPDVDVCSGVLVRNDLIATAKHCLAEKDVSQFVAVLDYTGVPNQASKPKISPSKIIKISKKQYESSDEEDFTLLQIDPIEDPSRIAQFQRANTADDSLQRLPPLLVMGHPLGMPMHSTAARLYPNSISPTEFETRIAGLPGSSGGPAFNSIDGRLEGIVSKGGAPLVWTYVISSGSCNYLLQNIYDMYRYRRAFRILEEVAKIPQRQRNS